MSVLTDVYFKDLKGPYFSAHTGKRTTQEYRYFKWDTGAAAAHFATPTGETPNKAARF